MRSGRLARLAMAELSGGRERLPVGIAVLVIAATSALCWAALIGIGAGLLRL